MSVEAFISFGNELPIESPFAAPGLVAPTQNDAFAFRVEGERESPNTIRRIEAQFFHVRVARALQRVHPRAPKLRPECLQHRDVRQESIFTMTSRQSSTRWMKPSRTSHPNARQIMALGSYGVKSI